MRPLLALLFLCSTAAAQSKPDFDVVAAERFAKLALACVHQEYPNKLSHTLNSDADVAPPRQLTPAFYGCYDWHSSVHGHWMLARLAREYPDAPFAGAARTALKESISPENVAAEVKYMNGAGRASFERPYGLAWLLQLGEELREWAAEIEIAEGIQSQRRPLDERPPVKWSHPPAPEIDDLANTLRPLERAAVARLKTWLPKLSHPVRSGEHSQTAFALGLMLDYARGSGDKEFEQLLVDKARAFYMRDKDCPLNYEPSGEDFLSPCLAEADVMRRVLTQPEYIAWLRGFLPDLFRADAKSAPNARPWLAPEVVTDPSDPKLAHLDGLNLSRAWMLEGVALGLHNPDWFRSRDGLPAVKPAVSPAVVRLWEAAKAHRNAGVASVTGEHYEGGHWLGSFAVYLVTKRGIR